MLVQLWLGKILPFGMERATKPSHSKDSSPRTSSYTKRTEQGFSDVSAAGVEQDPTPLTPQNAEFDEHVSECRSLTDTKANEYGRVVCNKMFSSRTSIVYDNFYFEQNLHYIECLDYSYKFILS